MERKLLYLFLFVYSFSQAQCFGSLQAPGYTVLPDGTLWYTGNVYRYTGFGLPQGSPVFFAPFNQIGTASDWSQKYSGSSHMLFIKSNGHLWGWGLGQDGQVGNGTFGSQNTITAPVLVSTDQWIEVSAGTTHSLGIKNDGTLWAWGRNDVHQLGLNSSVGAIHYPTQVGVDNDWSKVFCSATGSLAIKSNGTLWVWGTAAWSSFDTNNEGEIPQQVGTDADWVDISAAFEPFCALKSNGTIWAWGENPFSNYSGFYGNGFPDTNNYENGPIQVGTDTDWVKIKSWSQRVIALKENGTIWVWGNNELNDLGLGISGNQYTPQQIGSQTNWIDIGVLGGRFFAKNSEGQLFHWGRYLDVNYNNVFVYLPTQYGSTCVLSIEDTLKKDIHIYPNPVEDYLNITLQNISALKHSIFIYNSLGQLMYENQYTQNEFSIPVSHFVKGVYFLRVDHGDGVEQVKFVKR
jgi:alpha-tubulin suppressor-like RCC1 family protein